jgi:hypothetical protein
MLRARIAIISFALALSSMLAGNALAQVPVGYNGGSLLSPAPPADDVVITRVQPAPSVLLSLLSGDSFAVRRRILELAAMRDLHAAGRAALRPSRHSARRNPVWDR